MLEMLKKFLRDKEAESMYVTGQAGTGKTTELNELIEWCIANNIEYQVCAYTHNACDILRSKLPLNANICTLHSFLEKCPTINAEATKVKHVEGNSSASLSSIVELLFIDEFSMIGEKDVQDIIELQYKVDEMEEDYDGEHPIMKVVYIGDQNQLPPVKDVPAVVPMKPYHLHLTKIYRQASDNPLIVPLTQLVTFIEGATPMKLVESDKFIRHVPDFVKQYKECKNSKIILAYTNQRVQDLNFEIMEKEEPELGDRVFSPSLHRHYIFNGEIDGGLVYEVIQHNNKTLTLGSKWKTLEYMIKSELCKFYELEDAENGRTAIYPIIFGTKNYNNSKDTLAEAAVKCNNKIESEMGVKKAMTWSKMNWAHPLAKERAIAWKKYMAVKASIFGLDFAHAMTVHKSQGMTIDTVFLEEEDLKICLRHDLLMYCKLFYVAISRASNKVITN